MNGPETDAKRKGRAERATVLIPWATAGWAGYSPTIHQRLHNAARAEQLSREERAEHWLSEAERYASHACKWDSVVFRSVGTYREAWDRFKDSPGCRLFVWPIPVPETKETNR